MIKQGIFLPTFLVIAISTVSLEFSFNVEKHILALYELQKYVTELLNKKYLPNCDLVRHI